MSKPEDIPQDVWDTAEIALKFVPAGNDAYQIASVARAIMAAKAEEREACALIADEHSQVLRGNFDRSCAIAVESLAAAIRKREG